MCLLRELSDDSLHVNEVIIEPSDIFHEKYPLIMALTLVDIAKNTTAKVRIMNPFNTEVSINQDAVIGKAEQVKAVVVTMTEAEITGEEQNFE